MKKVVIILLVLFSLKSNSQVYLPFPIDSAVWLTQRTCQVPFCPPRPGSFNNVLQLNDTTINSLNYHKIYDYSNNQLNSFYRESNKKIYSKYPLGGVFGNDTSEFVLYDFNLQIGDSMNVKIPANWITASGPIIRQPKIYVSSTGTIVINSTIHKTLSFTSNNFGGCSVFYNWIEGIGSNSGLFYNLNYNDWAICISYPAPYDFSLSCHFKNNALIYDNNCITTSLPILSDKFNLSIAPNPINSILNISTISDTQNQLQNATIQITNYFGQVVFTSPFISQINMSSFSSGIYFLTIQNNSNRKSLKFIIE